MSDNHSSANILPKSLSILIETLVAHNEISSWNIYQNQDNATCVTIRFSGLSHDKHMSPAKYRKISDKQMSRNRKRMEKFQSKFAPVDHDKVNIDNESNCEINTSKKRKMDYTSPEQLRSDVESPSPGEIIDTPIRIKDIEYGLSLASPDNEHISPVSGHPPISKFNPLHENDVHVESKQTEEFLPPSSYAESGSSHAVPHPVDQTCETSPPIPTPTKSNCAILENFDSTEGASPSTTVILCPCCDLPMDSVHTCDQIINESSSSIVNMSALSNICYGSSSPSSPIKPPQVPPNTSISNNPPSPKPPDETPTVSCIPTTPYPTTNITNESISSLPGSPLPSDQIPPELIACPMAYKYLLSIGHHSVTYS